MKQNGFTLLELLVVVLIIGILAAVALPQYQKAVEKTRALEAIALLKTVSDAQEVRYLASGNYADSFDELDIDIPWTGNTEIYPSTYNQDALSNEEWSLQIQHLTGMWHQMLITRLRGKYKGAGFLITSPNDFNNPYSTQPLGVIVCWEPTRAGFSGTQGAYCQKILKGTEIYDFGGTAGKAYKLP